ncbi:MAG: hypothetical protein AAFX99_04285 [Myxococcota bacterium]
MDQRGEASLQGWFDDPNRLSAGLHHALRKIAHTSWGSWTRFKKILEAQLFFEYPHTIVV